MVYQPNELVGKISSKTSETCDELEGLIDGVLEDDYDEGFPVTIEYDSSLEWTEAVDKEIRRMYHGWDLVVDVEANTITLTPKPIELT